MPSFSPKSLLLFFFSSILLDSSLSFSSATLSASNGTSVYDLLRKFGLPPGLLPDTVTNFSLSDDGRFVVDLAGPCYVEFEYLVYYEPRITGTIQYGSISDLKGIQVRRFLIWFDVDAIKVDLPPGDYIYFQVGWITKKLTVGQFETVQSCRDNRLDFGRLKDRAKRVIQLPEPVREINMLLTE